MESMSPGTKRLNLGWFANSLSAGLEADLDYKPYKNFSLFTSADVLYTYKTRQTDWQVLGGLRWKF